MLRHAAAAVAINSLTAESQRTQSCAEVFRSSTASANLGALCASAVKNR
jgi:hypothetical protein